MAEPAVLPVWSVLIMLARDGGYTEEEMDEAWIRMKAQEIPNSPGEMLGQMRKALISGRRALRRKAKAISGG